MHRSMTPALLAALLAAGALAGCERGADSGATANPVAPGRPGTGNPVEQVAPTPDPSPQSPQVGGPRDEIPQGITGSGGPTRYPGQPGETTPAPAVPGGLGLPAGAASGTGPAGAPGSPNTR